MKIRVSRRTVIVIVIVIEVVPWPSRRRAHDPRVRQDFKILGKDVDAMCMYV
jgi:hypothetical protein